MSNGMYETFAERNRKPKVKWIKINKHVSYRVYANGKKLVLRNEKEGTSISLLKTTFDKLQKSICSTN